MIELYTYFRSSASYRIRIALTLKEISYEPQYVHLLKDGGQQHKEAYLKLNPQGLVPTLVDDNEQLTQSLAIIEYLDEQYPEPPLLPADAVDKAWVRSMSQLIMSEIHTITNLRVLKYLTETLSISEEEKLAWIHNWFNKGLTAFEKRLEQKGKATLYSLGKRVSMVDVCLVPMIYNALRYEVPLDGYPVTREIYNHCMAQPAFVIASPENQEDYLV